MLASILVLCRMNCHIKAAQLPVNKPCLRRGVRPALRYREMAISHWKAMLSLTPGMLLRIFLVKAVLLLANLSGQIVQVYL